ncbi:hypothetical protein ACI76O_11865 [Capnocytophaga cynodegmi]|uniref:hypothetical protein n=1 Tax=Capnocytophaga cynodegmi TaxID=28189 RepID=UPI00385BCB84
MYKLEEIKQGIGGFYITPQYIYYTLKSDKYRLYVFENQTKKNIFVSEEERVNRFDLYEDNLVYISRNEESIFLVNLKTKIKNHINKILYGLVDNYYKKNENFYIDKDEEKIYIYDLTSGNITKKFDSIIIGYPKLNTNSHIVTQKDSYIYIYIKNDFSLLWEKNLSDITSYKDYDGSLKQGEIREIYSYNNTLIILTQVFILRLHIETGEIIYSLRLPAGLMTLSIEENKAYGCYGYHYMEIDLEKGELINFVRIENALLNGKEYNAIMNKASYKDGFVFHGLRLEGGQYAVGAINTKTGNREWISLLSFNMVEKIEFHDDKMFISDTGGNLFIYQRE